MANVLKTEFPAKWHRGGIQAKHPRAYEIRTFAIHVGAEVIMDGTRIRMTTHYSFLKYFGMESFMARTRRSTSVDGFAGGFVPASR